LDGQSSNPILDLAQINTELSLFDPELSKKPQVVALNKIDLPDVQDKWKDIELELKKKGIFPLAVSAIAGINLQELLHKTAEMLKETPIIASKVELPTYRAQSDPRQYSIKRTPKGWKIAGESIERAAAMTFWENDESIRRFQKILEALGIDEDLRKAGVKDGEMVTIGDYELEWRE
jgi:GTP-binding protein